MDAKLGKKVFIVGSSACEYSLAKKMIAYENVSEVFVAPGNDAMKEFCTVVDIREQNVEELLEFALENAVDLTIASSDVAIKNDITTVFQNNNQMIFAPTHRSSEICSSKASGKKFMYRNRIPCPRFGVYDKPSLAIDYVTKSDIPIVVKTDSAGEKGVLVCHSTSIANAFVDELFIKDENKVLIEEYIFGHEFSFYVVTDGYHAIPLGSVATYKNELEGNGGRISSGMGSFVPDYKVSSQVEQKIMQQIIYPTLNTLSNQHTPYVGVLGVDMVMNDEEQLFVINFNSFLKSPDAQSILATLDENLYDLFEACAVGSFGDDYESINISDKHAVSCVLCAKKNDAIIEGFDDLDEDTLVAHFNTRKNTYLEYETVAGRSLVLTRTARILSKAMFDLYEEVPVIKFDGMKYRRDIGKNLRV